MFFKILAVVPEYVVYRSVYILKGCAAPDRRFLQLFFSAIIAILGNKNYFLKKLKILKCQRMVFYGVADIVVEAENMSRHLGRRIGVHALGKFFGRVF